MAPSKQPIPSNTCTECGSPMVYETRPDTIEYGGEKRDYPMLAWWCTECDEAIFEGQPLLDRQKAYLELKAEVDQVLSPAQVAAVRTKLGLSQRKAGELLGGGPRSFYKYENGKQAVSVPMSHLLTLLDNDVSRLEELRGAAERLARSHGFETVKLSEPPKVDPGAILRPGNAPPRLRMRPPEPVLPPRGAVYANRQTVRTAAVAKPAYPKPSVTKNPPRAARGRARSTTAKG